MFLISESIGEVMFRFLNIISSERATKLNIPPRHCKLTRLLNFNVTAFMGEQLCSEWHTQDPSKFTDIFILYAWWPTM